MTPSSVAPVPVDRVDPPVAWTADALRARLDRGEPFPIVGDGICLFAFHGPAIRVRMVHFGVGLPKDLDFSEAGDWWLLGLRFPPGSRFEYKVEVTDSFGTHLIEDPLNPLVARHPFGGNSVCEAEGYHEPAWAISRPDVPTGSIVERGVDSAALGRHAAASMYLPAGFDGAAAHRYPVVILHDGGDYFHYAGLATVLDQLIAGGALPPVIVAGLHPVERLVEYADDAQHHEFVTTELVEWLDAEYPLSGERYLAGASFGAVASFSAAVAAPQRFDGLLLQSGSFAGAGTGCWPRPEPLWQPVKRFVERFLADPFPVAKRVAVTCGLFESLICENRGLVPTLSGTGMSVSFDEWLDGHNWASWRNSLGVALPRLLAG